MFSGSIKLSSSGISDFVGRLYDIVPEILYGSQITGSGNKFAVFTDTHVVPKRMRGFMTIRNI